MRIPIVLLVFAACAGDSPPPSGQCTGAPYDLCNAEHECLSNLCQNFMAEGFQVCSQACDGSNPCPDDGTCNADGVCQPAAPNECEL